MRIPRRSRLTWSSLMKRLKASEVTVYAIGGGVQPPGTLC
jgi:hypothetical protein